MRNLISSYTRFAYVVYSGEVKVEVGTRSRMRCVGWVVGSGTNLTFYLPTIYNTRKSSVTAYCVSHYQPEDGQWIVPKHVVDLCVINNTYLFHKIVVLDSRYIPIWFIKTQRRWRTVWRKTAFASICRDVGKGAPITDGGCLAVFVITLLAGECQGTFRDLYLSINQLVAQNLFHNKFYFILLHVSSTCAHHQEVKNVLHSLWYSYV